MRTVAVGFFCAAIGTLCLAPSAAAQTYPSKPVTLVATVPPGGSIDVMARWIGQELGKSLGQPVVVENRPGAGGNIAADHVARSAPDGYTLMITSSSTLTINPHVYRSLPFNPEKSFVPIVIPARLNMVLVVHPKHDVTSVHDLAGRMKADKGKFNFASSGVGTLPHLASELLTMRVGAQANHVPYKGLGPAMNDLLAGQVDFMFDSASSVPHIKAGKLRALAVVGPNRLAAIPDVPTFREIGIDGMETAAGWYGIFAPNGTPRPIVDRLSAEIRKILDMPATKERFIAIGLEPATSTPEELGAALSNDLKQLGQLVRQLNLQLQ
ncbi:MAG TPA: tripartite tricarboxylate transporter substrate binding protein [Burkholderiaceae bacterium]|jgi:tripartite-type tricarboxylate transporter receptor subunit TctC|nr:tripartite tricarboxylate transporter substrate binding protein [Burkholderiaceae bacterium]